MKTTLGDFFTSDQLKFAFGSEAGRAAVFCPTDGNTKLHRLILAACNGWTELWDVEPVEHGFTEHEFNLHVYYILVRMGLAWSRLAGRTNIESSGGLTMYKLHLFGKRSINPRP